MPAGLVRPSSEIEPIVGIQFGIFSPEEIERRSVVEITTHAVYEGSEPKIGGLFDPRMGVLENGKTCRSCGQTNHNCPGHFGHYKLARPVYYIQFFPYILNVLNCVCIRCSKLLVDKDLHKGILNHRGEARWREILNRCGNISRCGQETEDGCGARKPNKFERDGIARIVAIWDNIEGPAMDKAGNQKKQPLEVEYVLRLFRRITDEDVDFMGLNRYWCRPDWMICTVLPIPPPQVRPSVIQDNNQRSEDDLTHKLFDIIKNNQTLQEKIDANASKHIIDEYTNVVQYHVATLVDNQIPGVAPSAQRSGRPLKSIQQRLGSKEGRIRYNIQGKRVEFSARSVITPDPNLSIGEIGVPEKIAMNLTVPERVTIYNKEQMYKLIQNGADKYPGAKTLIKADGRMISLKHVNRMEIVLKTGDTVNRHLADGDIILFNRQPTLHRMSMMGHRVKVLPYNTFRLNVSVTAPYNADFDGDEMNAHIPQSYEASTELSEIAAVPYQIVSPRNGKPVIGIVQDTLVGSYRITRPQVNFNRREFMNLMMWNKRFEGIVPKAREKGRWTGQQVLSELMPPINLKMENDSYKDNQIPENVVEIEEGNIKKGIFDKSIFSKPSKGIVHVTYNDYGPQATVNFIDSMQNTVEQFLVYNGFSVGISDLVADKKTNDDIQAAIQAKKREVEDMILSVHLDVFDNNTGKSNQDELESRILGILNKANDEAGKMGLASLAQENRLTAMVKAGSKGSTVNIAQMMACLGQQAPEGRRIPYGFTDRTLPHYKKYDDGAEARGFVESSFIRGLTPQEFFFHAMSGREGLIDTAVKTADTGYIQRQLIKAMEDLTIQYDGSVRDARGKIVQFHYGEDGINSTKIESATLKLEGLTEADIQNSYGMVGIKWDDVLEEGTVREETEGKSIENFVKQIFTDRKMLVEDIYRNKTNGSLFAPLNLDRIITNMKVKFRLDPAKKTDLTPAYVLKGLERILSKTQRYHALWAALLRFHCAPHKLIVKERFTKQAFDTLCEVLVIKNWQAWAQPGEQVGIIAAQSIGEPSTQMTLNTFHLAGVAAKSNMTRGVPRLKELLKVTQNPKGTALTVFLKPEYRSKKEKAREVAQDLELTLLRDITIHARIYFDPQEVEGASVVPEDRALLNFFHLFEKQTMKEGDQIRSRWVLRLELDRERMFNKNITMDDIAFVLENRFGSEITTRYSDFNASKLVLRISVKNDGGDTDELTTLKRFQNKLLNSVVIRGVPGIKAVTFRKEEDYVEYKDGQYKAVENQYVLDTDGSNFLEVMNHPAVDGRKLLSTHVWDIYENLGIEATRQVLLNEISDLFEEAGVNFRHLGLLCDVMTRAGRLMSVDRYGINKNEIGPLAKASFEETEKILLRAALFGEVDPITGVSANIMMGQPIRGGTSFSQILLDETYLWKILTSMSEVPKTLDEEDSDDEELTQEQIDAEQGGIPTGPCDITQLRMSLQMPSVVPLDSEPAFELEELAVNED
ncbi:MAG: DNA-directed RNA polymerase subunit A' [Flavobacteriia bacterium]|nr:DNA-directed RNA polymerase subunit A' [Flavobacteriia bacterium]